MQAETRILVAALLYPGIKASGHKAEVCIQEALATADALIAAGMAPVQPKPAAPREAIHVPAPAVGHAYGSTAPPIGQQSTFASPPTAQTAAQQGQPSE
jgi:hypothetical protein